MISFGSKILLIASVLLAMLLQPQGPVFASANLTITPITWNVVGLDSNNVNVGPNNFPVGARVCNTGDAATNVTANFVWEDTVAGYTGPTPNPYVHLRTGSAGSTSPITLSTLAAGTAANPTCYDFYFEVTVDRNSAAYSSYDQTTHVSTNIRRYHIDISATGVTTLSTPSPRDVFVEHLISQNRNGVDNVELSTDGINYTSYGAGTTMSLMVGNTYHIRMDGHTATQGYNQLEDFINLPNTIFQVLAVSSTYSADSSTFVANSSDKLYADACLWDPDPNTPTYLSCIGSDGKIGGTISTDYTVKIISGAGTTQTLSTLIYDFSGSSFHYNSDLSTSVRYASISSPLTMTKSFSPTSITSGGTSTLTITINNTSSSDVTGVGLTDPMPSGVTISGSAASSCGGISNTTGSITLTNATIPTAGCTIQATVTSSTKATYTNTTDDLFINGSDTGTNASANLTVASTSSGSGLCGLTLAEWTFTGATSATNPLPSTNNVSAAAASTTVSSPTIDTNANDGNPAPSWQGQGFDTGSSVNPDTSRYFQFQIDTSNYSNVQISFDYLETSSNWASGATILVYTSTTGASGSFALSGSNALTASRQNSTFTATSTGASSTYFRIFADNAQNTNAALSIDNVTFTGCGTAQQPTITKAFSPATIGAGGTSQLQFTLTNPNSASLTGVAFSDTLPSGVTVSGTPATPQCGGTISSTSNSIALSGGTLAAGSNCTVMLNVTAASAGAYINTSGYISSNESGTNTGAGGSASATLTVLAPPVISKSFSPNPIYAGGTSTLTFTITNPNASAGLSGVGFTDTFPSGLTVSTAPATPQCSGTVSSTSGSITLGGGSIAAGGSCTVTVATTASTVGSYANTSGNISAIISGVTYDGNTASDTLGVQTTHPGISILKQVSTSASGPWGSTVNVASGQSVYYQFTIENIGDVPLSPVSITDSTLDTSSCVWPSTLPVGTSSVDPTATCVVGPVTAQTGSHSNTATAHGTYNGTVYDSTPSTATYATTALTLAKSLTSVNGNTSTTSFSAAGDVLAYSYTITNNGAVSLALPAAVTDSNTSVSCPAVDTSGNQDGNLDPGENIVCTATYTVTAFDVSVGSVTNTAYATVSGVDSNRTSETVYMNLPDLVVSKTNDTGGYAYNQTPFNWTLTVSNVGPQPANFASAQTILSDPLPAARASYGTLPVSLPIASSTGITGTINCSIDASDLLTCAASGSVTIGATTGSFAVNIPVTPTAIGSLVNSSAVVDPNNNVSESNEGNNQAADSVTVSSLSAPSISKSFSPNPIAAGGTSTLTFTIANSNAAALSGVAFTDTFPTGLTVASAPATSQCSGTVSSTSGSISLSGGSIAANSSCTVTVSVTASAGGTYSNVSGAVSSTNGGTGNTASAKLGVIGAAKTIVSTSEDSTNGGNVAIGEIVRYRAVFDLPEGTSSDLQVVDDLVGGLRFLNDGTAKVAFVCTSTSNCSSDSISGTGLVVAGNSPTGVTPTFVLPDAAVSSDPSSNLDNYPSGGPVYFKLGNVTNNDNDTDNEYVVLEFNALVDNTASNAAPGTHGNTFSVTIGGATVVTSSKVSITIVEPSIGPITKSVKTAPTDAGDSITYEFQFTNSGSGPAFDINLTDVLDSTLTGPVTFGGSTTGGSCGSTASTVDGFYTTPNAVATVTCLAAGGTATVDITATVSSSAPAGKTFSNSASLTYTSLPGSGTSPNSTGSTTPGPNGSYTGERDGSGSVSSDTYTASSNTVNTTLASPSLAKDINPSGTSYAIGATIPYRIQITVPEGVTGSPTANLADVIPTGLNYVSGSLSVSLPSGVTVGTAGTLDDTNSSFFNLSGQTMTLTFGSITSAASSSATNRIVTVTFQAQVANVVGNQSGTTFTNPASFTYSDPNNSGSTLTLNASAPATSVIEPDLTISKAVSSSTPAYSSTLTYTLTVAHSGASNAPAYDTLVTDTMPSGLTGLTNINVSSSSPSGCATGVDTSASTSSQLNVSIGTIPLGCTVTITYDVTVSGAIGSTQTNSAEETWTSLSGNVSGERTGADGVGGALNDYAAATSQDVTVSSPDLRVTKDDGSTTYLPGNAITYTIIVYNDGNVTASGTVTDNPPAALTSVSWTCTSSGSATCGASGTGAINDSVSIPAGEHVTYTLNATVDLSATGDLSNTASASLTGYTDPTPSNNSATDTDTSAAAPSLTVKKSSTTASISATGVVDYSYLVTNTGNVTVTGISVTDNNIDAGSMSCPSILLAVGASMTCTAQHTVTQAELDADGSPTAGSGNLTNTVTVTSTNAPTATDTLNIPISQSASLGLTKSASPTTFTASSQTITYTYTLTNNGNVSLTSPYTITDNKIASANISCASATSPLAPGTSTTCTGTYSTTASDVSAGSLTNTASATAKFGSADVTSSSAQATINLAALSVTKTETSTGPYAVNDTITYNIVVTNTGSTTLTGVTVSDPGTGATLGACSPSIPAALTAGASVTCAASHVVTQSDIDAGSYSNTASGTSDQVGPQTSTVKINFTQTPTLSLTKSASPSTYSKVGDTINYSYVLKNTGNVTLSNPFTVTDDKTSVTCPPTPTSLAPGDTITCTAAYSIVAADLTNGSLTNHATGHAMFGTTAIDSNQGTATVNAQVGSLSGTVFNDTNTNGTQDSGESGLSGVIIKIYDSTGTTLIATTTTDANGHYAVSNLAPGDYQVVEQDPSGYVSTTPNTVAVSVPANGTAQANFGDYRISGTSTNNISGTVFDDANNNGSFDSGEQVIPNVTITLYDQNNNVVATTTTGANGTYSFNNLPAGVYTVVETNPSGYISTTLDHVGVTLSSGTNAVVNYGDRQSSATIVDPAVTKYGDPSQAQVGDLVTYTITVGNNGNADALNVVLTDTKPVFLDIISINISPNKSFPVTISGNTFTIDFGTVTPADFYTVTVLTRVNSLGQAPGGTNNASITTSSSNDPTFNDAASATLTIPSSSSGNGTVANASALPHTGFAPGVVTAIGPKPANVYEYDASNDLIIEIPALRIKTSIVGVPQSGNSWDVTWLGNQVGYLDGTAFPTWSGNSVLTGHVYGANGLPGPFVNLHTLKWGDQIIIHFQGQRYIYEVRENKVVSPTDMSVLKHENQPWLTLITCKDYNAGTNTYAHRVEVGAVLVKVEADTSSSSGGR